MNVEITFQPAGLTGLVAQGTYLLDAARRMGVRVSEACKGRGECTACVVLIVAGHSLLSAPSEHERRTLGEEALAQNQRLACETIINSGGELVVQIMTEQKHEKKPDVS